MKMSLRILGIILVGLFAIFTVGCGQDEDVEPEEAGTYTLVSTTLLGITLHAPEFVTGELNLNSGSNWTMDLDDEKYGGDSWDPVANILYSGSDRIPYTFDGDTLRFTIRDDDAEIDFVWRKIS